MGFVVGVLRVLFALFVARMLVRFIHGLVRPRQAPTRAATAKPARGGELVRDRVCNTALPRESALQATVGGEAAFFCSEACRDKALAGFARAS